MDLIDRLISGAGAVADAADRFAGLFRRGGGGRRGPAGPVVVAAGLSMLAILFLLVGVEGSDLPTPRAIGPGVDGDVSYGDHAYVTVSGEVASEFDGHFFDDNGDGTQDPGEADADYVYVVQDPATHAGVTVVSPRSPGDVYRTSRAGMVREDASYIADDMSYISDDIADLGIKLDKDRYVDARLIGAGSPETIHLADGLPDAGTSVSLDGGIVATWTYLCPTSDDCDESQAESFDVLLYDEATRRGIIVVTDTSPEWTPVTFSGMLRREEHAVSEALDSSAFDLDAMGVTVSSRYLLDDGTTPVDPIIAWVLAAICGVLAGLILIGLAGGFLIYRRGGGALPAAAGTLRVGEGVPLRVTGVLRTSSGLTRVREAPADLVRFATVSTPSTSTVPLAADPEPASTLIVERRGRPEGVAVGVGELARMSVGDVFPLRGRRAAMRAVAGTGPLLLSFDTSADRDRAVAELLQETTPPPSPSNVEA